MPPNPIRPETRQRLRPPTALLMGLMAATLLACGGDGPPEAVTDNAPSASVALGKPGDPGIRATLETPNETGAADMDDPAVWLHPRNKARSLVIAAAKRGGLRVYDLQARELQRIDAVLDSAGKPLNRFNNVDVQYEFNLNGRRVDLAVTSDRQQDRLRVYRIDPDDAAAPLKDITSPAMARVFATRPDPADRARQIDNPDDGRHTAYGLALWRDVRHDKLYALVNQNNEAVIAMLELQGRPDGTVDTVPVQRWQFPYVFQGQDLTQEDDEDPSRDFSPQFEGMVADQQTGTLYAGQEDVGIWRIDLQRRVAEAAPFVRTTAFDPQSRLARDVEGLTLYYGAAGDGYLLASSQGQAHGEPPTLPAPGLDDTFAVFSRLPGNRYLGSFSIAANRAQGIDAVQECDGADVVNVSLPGFGGGLLITQDGYNDDLNNLDGKVAATNLKFTPWHVVAENFPGGRLKVDPNGYNPRRPGRR